ncbi:hypothetical protein [uncultured Stenotrophomonas sp.]|uniref:hypothetical protein n=1 Tax=uncultured Stenotrophomonas sp. TaxID=165438 RepID=UPI0025F54447|nr:hypothetical protein [uncultured Stenotrophomonas sp.]
MYSLKQGLQVNSRRNPRAQSAATLHGDHGGIRRDCALFCISDFAMKASRPRLKART